MWVQSLVWEDSLEEGMATHSSILAWRIPLTEELGRLQSKGLQRVGHDWSDLTCTYKVTSPVNRGFFQCFLSNLGTFYFFFLPNLFGRTSSTVFYSFYSQFYWEIVDISLSCVLFFATSWTIDHQGPLPMGFPRQEYWRRLPFSSPGDLPHPGIKPMSPALAARFFTTKPPGKPPCHCIFKV